MNSQPSTLRLRPGRLIRAHAERPGATEWEVEVEGEGAARALAYPELVGPLSPGDRVLLNTTAVALELGTGGLHFVVASLEARETEEFAGREAGHVLKLRYTPLQLRVRSVEEEGSPHGEAIAGFQSLGRTPVVCAELHSQMAAAAIAAHAAAPSLRLACVLTDSAALPAGISRLLAALREEEVITAVVTAGQSFGGDYEAVNLYTGLIAARAVAGAEVILVAQGPGNVGTGSEYGFSGLALLEGLHAAEALGGRPVLVARLSFADHRERHRGLSHHTLTLLRLARCPVELPLPALSPGDEAQLGAQLIAARVRERHIVPVLDVEPAWKALAAFEPPLTSMGRRCDQDPAFFAAAAAAGLRSAALAQGEK